MDTKKRKFVNIKKKFKKQYSASRNGSPDELAVGDPVPVSLLDPALLTLLTVATSNIDTKLNKNVSHASVCDFFSLRELKLCFGATYC
jgi:hypothetical protein